jgi:hypothetical protein
MARSKSSEVFLEVVAELVRVLTDLDFVYNKSKHTARRQGLLFEQQVTFSSSRSINSIPGNVHLEIKALAWSQTLANYRSEHGLNEVVNDGYFVGTTIENLFVAAPPYIRYNVGDPNTRAAVKEHISQVLQSEVLRFFTLIDSPDQLKESLSKQPIPSLSETAIQQYFACFVN